MLKFLPFTNQPTLATNALVNSTYINGVKNNVETYLNSIDTITDSTKTVNTTLTATDLINPVDASSAGVGGLNMTLPQISTLSGLVGGFYFKKIDNTFNPVYISPFNERIENLRQPATVPTSFFLTLEVPDQAVTIYPVNNIWRIFQHYLPISSLGCRAYLNNSQNIALINTFAKIAFDTKDYDPNNLFDVSQSQFTAPISGLYQIAGTIGAYSVSGSARDFTVSAFINNSQSRALFQITNIPSSQNIDLPFSSLIKLNRGDALSLCTGSSQVFNIRAASTITYLEIQLISL